MSIFALSCLIISLTTFVLFISGLALKYRSISCISEGYYLAKKSWMFTLGLLVTSMAVLPAWLESSPENYQFLAFLSCVSLMGVAVFPKYLESDRTGHIVSALCAMALSLLWSALTGHWIILLAVSGVAMLLLVTKINNKFFWLEVLGFANIYLSLLLRL
jgi:hypothetical protein